MEVALYADDTAFFVSGLDPNEMGGIMSSAASDFLHYCNLNRLTLNLDKSIHMTISGTKRLKKRYRGTYWFYHFREG